MSELFVSISPHTFYSFASVVRCSWSVIGGPEQVVIELHDDGGLDEFQQLLGQPIEIFTASGSKIWWGYISAVRQKHGQFPQVIDLEEMAKRVSACYEELEPGSLPGEYRQTAWFENPQSQSVYGVKEKVLLLGMTGLAQSNQIGQRYLTNHAWPMVRTDSHSVSLREFAGDNDGSSGPNRIELTCQGWIHRLSWRYWQTKSGMLGHSPAQVGLQKIGELAANQTVAQSFKLEMTQDVSYVKLRLRKEGNPTDALSISIHSDTSGRPSGTSLASASLAASLISADGYSWCRVSFSTLPKLTAGVNYWLVMQRSESLNAIAYYLAGVDKSASYLNAVLRVYNSSNGLWSSRLPVANLLFQMGPLKATEELMQEMLLAVGQEFSGLQIEAPTGLILAPFVPRPVDGLSALKLLLELGGSNFATLLVSVNPEKMLRIYPQPDANTAVFMIDQDGNLCHSFGYKVDLESLPTGRWVTIVGTQSVFIRQVVWNANKARLTINY